MLRHPRVGTHGGNHPIPNLHALLPGTGSWIGVERLARHWLLDRCGTSGIFLLRLVQDTRHFFYPAAAAATNKVKKVTLPCIKFTLAAG